MLDKIADQGVIPVLRCATVEDAIDTARACADAGAQVIELTCTTPHVERALEALRDDGLLLGVGTVTHHHQIASLAQAGARFVVSFVAPVRFVEIAHGCGLTAIPAGVTPQEIFDCYECGADAVKLYPASTHAPAYLAELRVVMPKLRMIVSGGIKATEASTGAWLRAGALAAGIGGEFGTVSTCGRNKVRRRVAAALEVARNARIP